MTALDFVDLAQRGTRLEAAYRLGYRRGCRDAAINAETLAKALENVWREPESMALVHARAILAAAEELP